MKRDYCDIMKNKAIDREKRGGILNPKGCIRGGRGAHKHNIHRGSKPPGK